VNDPLYNHPVWQNAGAASHAHCTTRDKMEGEEFQEAQSESCSRQMEAIVGEIIRSKFEPVCSHQDLVSPAGEGKKEGKVADEHSIPTCGKDLQTSVEEKKASIDIPEEVEENEVGVSFPTDVRSQVDPNCTECKLSRDDPLPAELIMYLHALSYKVRQQVCA